MKVKTLLTCMLMASIIPFSSIVMANDNTPKEEKVIVLSSSDNHGTDDKALQVPVTATVNNGVVNVQFTGNVPMATVTVNNALTGTTVSQQTMSATAGTVSMIPVSGITMGTITVTNNLNGASVSGNFKVK